MKLKQLLLSSFILCSLTSFAQHDSIVSKVSNDKFIKLTYENVFFTGTDYYYTQGIRLEFTDPVLRYSPIMWLLPVLHNSVTSYGLVAVQDCFTPTNISSNTILYGDEPYAGYIYLGHYKISANPAKKEILKTELDAGEIGACASCEEEQKAIHSSLPGNIQPGGWQYQIGSGLLLNYKLQYEKALYTDTAINLDAMGQSTVGTVYDNALAGFALHAGKMQSYFSGNHSSAFQLYGKFQIWMEGMAYNGTMQGALFTHNNPYTLPASTLNRIVFGDSYGICMSYHKIQLEYSATRITNEIIKGYQHGFGHIGIATHF